MKIVRKLKMSSWIWDEEKNELILVVWIPNPNNDGDPDELIESIKINRVQMFSLFRFLVRVSQRLSRKSKRKKKEVV